MRRKHEQTARTRAKRVSPQSLSILRSRGGDSLLSRTKTSSTDQQSNGRGEEQGAGDADVHRSSHGRRKALKQNALG